MPNLKTILLSVLVCAASPGLAQSPAPSVNILALGEQSQPDSVPRDNRIYGRVVTALNDVMSRANVAVYDETAVTASFTSQSRALRSDAELIEIARAVPAPPLDALLIVEIQASAARRGGRTWYTPRVVVTGRILHLRTGRVFARLETGADAKLPDIPPDCALSVTCLIDTIGDQASPLAAELAAALMQRLASFAKDPNAPGQGGTAAPVQPPVTVSRPLRSRTCPTRRARWRRPPHGDDRTGGLLVV